MNKYSLVLTVALIVCGTGVISASLADTQKKETAVSVSAKKGFEDSLYYQACVKQCEKIWGNQYRVISHLDRRQSECEQACLIAVMREIMRKTHADLVHGTVSGTAMADVIAQSK